MSVGFAEYFGIAATGHRSRRAATGIHAPESLPIDLGLTSHVELMSGKASPPTPLRQVDAEGGVPVHEELDDAPLAAGLVDKE